MRILKTLFKLAAVVAVLLVAAMVWFAFTPLQLTGEQVDFAIVPGSGLRSATRQINEAGVTVGALRFELLARAAGKDTRLKAGSYQAQAGITPWRLLAKITEGDYTQSELAIIEGWNFRQVRAALAANADVVHDTAELPESEIMARLVDPGSASGSASDGAGDSAAGGTAGGTAGQSPEGWLFPDTYFFAKGSSDIAILRRAHAAMQKQLQSAWSTRAESTPLASPYEALILASIIEKETGNPADRPKVAAVFLNRMRAGMKLQTDPTVIYGMGEAFDGNLRRRDLERDTPFNTYTREGLPPAPIAMPGLASLIAATHPAKTGDLYFVARGDGSSQFSRSLEEHSRAVTRYQRNGGLQKNNAGQR